MKMNDKKYVIIILSLVVTIYALNTAYGQIGQNISRAGFLQYNNTEYGFTILYPSDWTAIEGDSMAGDYITNIVLFEPLGNEGKHYSKKFYGGEVALVLSIDNQLDVKGLNFDQYGDILYNSLKDSKGVKITDYNTDSNLGDKKAIEFVYKEKQGNRQYLKSQLDIPWGENFLKLEFKSRDKYSDQMLPIGNTMIQSLRFTNNTLAPVDNKETKEKEFIVNETNVLGTNKTITELEKNTNCIKILEPSFNGRQAVTVMKHGTFESSSGDYIKYTCDEWRQVAQYYVNHGYTVSSEYSNLITLSK
jgi:hypothetical protein